MTQKEKYKRAASAMRRALVSIMSDAPDTEYRMRAARDEIQAALPYEDSDYWRADTPIEGIAVEAEKLETEDEPDEGEAEKEKPTGKNAVQDVPETWQERMQCEYRETKARYEKLHRMVTKFEAGVLEFTPKSSIELLRQQKRHMGEYLHDLEIRGYVEGVEL